MVTLKALEKCTIAFKYSDEIVRRFEFNKDQIFEEEDEFIITKLVNTKKIIQL